MARSPIISITITSDDKTKAGFQSATRGVEKFGKKLVSTGRIALGGFVSNMATNAVGAARDFGVELFQLGGQTDVWGKKADTVFGGQVGQIRKWADANNEALGISDERLVGMAASLGDLLVPLGFTRRQAAGMTKDTLGLAGALSAWTGGTRSAEEVSQILTKAMLGEREQLKELGISINQAEVDERALMIARKAGRKEITKQDEALATQQLIFEKSTDAQKAWNDGSLDTIKNQNKVRASIDEAKTALAARLLPIVQKVTTWIADKFIPWVQRLVATFRRHWPEIKKAVQPVLKWFVETVRSVTDTIQALWDRFGRTILEFTREHFKNMAATIQAVVKIVQDVIGFISDVLSGRWGKAWEKLKNIGANIWKLIRLTFREQWNRIRAFFKLVWDAIGDRLTNALRGMKEAVQNGLRAVVGFVRGLPGRVRDVLAAVPTLLFRRGRQLIGGFLDGITGFWKDTLWPWVRAIPTTIRLFFMNAVEWLVGAGRSVLRGLWNGIRSFWSDTLWPGISAIPGNLLGIFTGVPDAMYQTGKAIIGALWDGIKFVWNNTLGGKGFSIPSWVPFIGGKEFRFPTLATGGIVTGPTLAMIGEAGPEVVIPLDRLAEIMGGAGGGRTVIQNFPPGISPTAVVDAQRRYARRNGPV